METFYKDYFTEKTQWLKTSSNKRKNICKAKILLQQSFLWVLAGSFRFLIEVTDFSAFSDVDSTWSKIINWLMKLPWVFYWQSSTLSP